MLRGGSAEDAVPVITEQHLIRNCKHLSQSRSHNHGNPRKRKRGGKYQQVPRELPESPGSTCKESRRGRDQAQRKESGVARFPPPPWTPWGPGGRPHRACALPQQPHRAPRPRLSEMLARVWPHPTQENKTFDSSRHKGTTAPRPRSCTHGCPTQGLSGRAVPGARSRHRAHCLEDRALVGGGGERPNQASP